MIAAIYSANGAIQRMIDGAEALVIQQVGVGEAWVEGEGRDDTHYVNLEAEPLIMARGDYTLEALPLPCTLTIEGIEYPCAEQPTFTFNYPGTYLIRVDAGVAFLQKEFEYDYQP